jgi:hypothetical protein
MIYKQLLGDIANDTTLYKLISRFLSQHNLKLEDAIVEPNAIVKMMLYFASPPHKEETTLFANHLNQLLANLSYSSPEDYQFILKKISSPTNDNSESMLLETLFEEGNLFAIKEYICKIPLPFSLIGYKYNSGNTLLHRLATVFTNINMNSENSEYDYELVKEDSNGSYHLFKHSKESPSSYLKHARDILVFLSDNKEYCEMLNTMKEKYFFNNARKTALDIFLDAYNSSLSENSNFDDEVPFLDELILLYPKKVLFEKYHALDQKMKNATSFASVFQLRFQMNILLGRLFDDELVNRKNQKNDDLSEKISDEEIDALTAKEIMPPRNSTVYLNQFTGTTTQESLNLSLKPESFLEKDEQTCKLRARSFSFLNSLTKL